MARTRDKDYIQNFRFHVILRRAGNEQEDPLAIDSPTGGQAGFSTASLPSFTLESAEYRDGLHLFTKKQPGPPSVDEITLNRGVTIGDTRFWDLVMDAALQNREYRFDAEIHVIPGTAYYSNEYREFSGGEAFDQTKTVVIFLYDCYASTCKPGGDPDATSSEISLAELTLVPERVSIRHPGDAEPRPNAESAAFV